MMRHVIRNFTEIRCSKDIKSSGKSNLQFLTFCFMIQEEMELLNEMSQITNSVTEGNEKSDPDGADDNILSAERQLEAKHDYDLRNS